jgi:hypothetical protein
MSQPTRFAMGVRRQRATLAARANRDGTWAVCVSCGYRLVRFGTVDLAAYLDAVARNGGLPLASPVLEAVFVKGRLFGDLVGWQPVGRGEDGRPLYYELSQYARRREEQDRALARDTTGTVPSRRADEAAARLSRTASRRDRQSMSWMPDPLKGQWSRAVYVGDVLKCSVEGCERFNRLDDRVAADALLRQVATLATGHPATFGAALAAAPPEAAELVRATVAATASRPASERLTPPQRPR